MTRLLLFLALLLLPTAGYAQGDLAAERRSLQGIEGFAADVTVEGPQHLVRSDLLRTEVILHRIVNRIRDAGLTVTRRDTEPPRTTPHLHVHLNLMEVNGGLVPFSVSAAFYQDVRLSGGRGEFSAATWDESVLGLVSPDLLATIPQSIDGLVDQFVDDFQAANH